MQGKVLLEREDSGPQYELYCLAYCGIPLVTHRSGPIEHLKSPAAYSNDISAVCASAGTA